MSSNNNNFLGKKIKGPSNNNMLKDQETDKNKKPSITQQNNPQDQQQQNNPNQVQPKQGTQTNQTSNQQQQPQQGNQNQQKSSFDKTKFDKQKNVLNEEQQAINDIYANFLKHTFFSHIASEGTKYSNSCNLLLKDYHQKIDNINKEDNIDNIKKYLIKCEKENYKSDKQRKDACIQTINQLANKEAAIRYVWNQYLQNVNSLQTNYEKQQNSFNEKKDLFNQYHAIFFNQFNINQDNKFADVSFEDIEGDQYTGKINLEKLRNEQAIYGNFTTTRSSPDNIITKTITGNFIDDKYADSVQETKDLKKGTISVLETKKGKPIKRTKYKSTDRTGSSSNIDVTVDEIDEKNNKWIHKFYPSRPKIKGGKCDDLEKTNKYSYIETDLKGMIHVPYVNKIEEDKKVVLYSMMNDEDTKSRMQLFKKKYGDKIQLIDTEVIKDPQDDTKEILQFKDDDSKLEIGKDQTKLDIFLLKHGAYQNFGKYKLDLKVIIDDIKQALETHPKIKEIYIKNYSCYNGLIDNNQYNFFNEFAKMIEGLIKDGKISRDIKVATSCPRNTDSETMRQTTDGKGKYGVRAISVSPLAPGEGESNLLAIETNKVVKNNGRGRKYQKLNVNKTTGECKFETTPYYKFCEEMKRGTFGKKDHIPNYYDKNQVPTKLQIEHNIELQFDHNITK